MFLSLINNLLNKDLKFKKYIIYTAFKRLRIRTNAVKKAFDLEDNSHIVIKL